MCLKDEDNRSTNEEVILQCLLVLLLSEDAWCVTVVTFCNCSSHAAFVCVCARSYFLF